MSFTNKITKYWDKPAEEVPLVLKILAKVFSYVSEHRKKSFLNSPSKVYRAPVPVVIVGNIFVGGTGKTPLVIALVELLGETGIRVGVVSRGYGGQKLEKPTAVFNNSDPAKVGDEPVLIATRAKCPVVVYPKRADAIQFLLKENEIDLIISDDGLQHYAMARDIEIVVIDGERRLGNGLLLPAGPLRESANRLNSTDYCIINGETKSSEEFSMKLTLSDAYALGNESDKIKLSAFAGRRVNAVAGIGNPSRFFNDLKSYSIDVVEWSFPDHYSYKLEDLSFSDDLPILMTEKDAVKCVTLTLDNVWVVPVGAMLTQSFKRKFVSQAVEQLKVFNKISNYSA